MKAEVTRARAIIMKDSCLLLIRRLKQGQEYFVLPGGKLENKETLEQGCLREIMEECGLRVEIIRELCRHEDMHKGKANMQAIFLCRYCGGTPILGGEEKEASTLDNLYQPVWVDIA